jgi:hypothetical protein
MVSSSHFPRGLWQPFSAWSVPAIFQSGLFDSFPGGQLQPFSKRSVTAFSKRPVTAIFQEACDSHFPSCHFQPFSKWSVSASIKVVISSHFSRCQLQLVSMWSFKLRSSSHFPYSQFQPFSWWPSPATLQVWILFLLMNNHSYLCNICDKLLWAGLRRAFVRSNVPTTTMCSTRGNTTTGSPTSRYGSTVSPHMFLSPVCHIPFHGAQHHFIFRVITKTNTSWTAKFVPYVTLLFVCCIC